MLSRIGSSSKPIVVIVDDRLDDRRAIGNHRERIHLKLRDEKRKEASPRTGQFARGILLGTNAYDERHFARANVFRHSVSLVEFTANYLSRALPTRTCNATLFAD